MDLTEKQKRFCDEYLIDLNGTQAAIRAGYSFPLCPEGYFVYFLCDPGNGSIFYIGKGKGRRPYDHMSECRKRIISNPTKYSKIREILESGNNVDVYYFATNLTETEAFTIERLMIKRIGRGLLTNKQSGVQKMSMAECAKIRLTEIVPLRRFIKAGKSADQVELYLRIVGEFHALAYAS